MKKLCAILLSVAMLLALIPVGAIPVAAATSGTTGDCTWTLDNDGHLTISGRGAMADYDGYNAAPWGTDITTVTIEVGVKVIGARAFASCLSLKRATIPDGATTINENAFYNCSSKQKTVTLTETVKTIGEGAFAACPKLTDVYFICTETERNNIVIGAGNEGLLSAVWHYDWFEIDSGVTGDCTWTLDFYERLSISGNGAMANYTSLDGGHETTAPWGRDITAVIIEDGVTTIGSSAFESCKSLTSVTIPDSVTTIRGGRFPPIGTFYGRCIYPI